MNSYGWQVEAYWMHTDRFLCIGKIQGTTEKQLDCKLLGERTVFVLLTASISGVAQMLSNIF